MLLDLLVVVFLELSDGIDQTGNVLGMEKDRSPDLVRTVDLGQFDDVFVTLRSKGVIGIVYLLGAGLKLLLILKGGRGSNSALPSHP